MREKIGGRNMQHEISKLFLSVTHIASKNLVFEFILNLSTNPQFNPFLPTGQLFAPKLIILIKCLIDILFFKVLF